jgi:hypothetical protein
MIGEEIGVENYNPPPNVWGIIANPVCTEFSTAYGFHKENDLEKGMFLVNNCLRIIDPALPKSINHLSFHNLRVGGTILDLEFERVGNTTACRVAKKRGNLRVVIEA